LIRFKTPSGSGDMGSNRPGDRPFFGPKCTFFKISPQRLNRFAWWMACFKEGKKLYPAMLKSFLKNFKIFTNFPKKGQIDLEIAFFWPKMYFFQNFSATPVPI
jgi:hypothetical protein